MTHYTLSPVTNHPPEAIPLSPAAPVPITVTYGDGIEVLKFKQIEAFQRLSASPNTKTIITDGKTPMVNMLY